MLKKSSFLVVILTAAVGVFSGCEQFSSFVPAAPVKPQGTIIAQIDNTYFITQERLDNEIEKFNALNAFYYNAEAKKFTKEEKLAFLKETLVPKYLMYKEARTKKIDKASKVQESIFNAEVQLLSDEFLKQEAGNISASAQEIESFYNTYKDRFKQDEERRAREILVPNEDEAKEVLIELLKGGDFAYLAQSHSKSETAQKGGDMGYVKRSQFGEDQQRFADTLFSLEKGQVSSVFKDKKGYYIVRIEDIRGGQQTPLNEVYESVKAAIISYKQQQKLQELRDALSKKSKVEIFQEKVK